MAGYINNGIPTVKSSEDGAVRFELKQHDEGIQVERVVRSASGICIGRGDLLVTVLKSEADLMALIESDPMRWEYPGLYFWLVQDVRILLLKRDAAS